MAHTSSSYKAVSHIHVIGGGAGPPIESLGRGAGPPIESLGGSSAPPCSPSTVYNYLYTGQCLYVKTTVDELICVVK